MSESESAALLRCRDRGFTPGARDVDSLLELYEQQRRQGARAGATAVVKALGRGELGVAQRLRRGWAERSGPQRAAAVEALTKIAGRFGVDAVVEVLAPALDDDDPRVVRQATRAVGKLEGLDAEPYREPLLRIVEQAALPERRAAADALGRVGGAEALARLERLRDGSLDDDELRRRVGQAIVLLRRRFGRATASAIVADAELPEVTTVWLRGRSGTAAAIEAQAVEWLPGDEHTRRVDGVRMPYRGSLRELYRVRTATEVGLEFAVTEGDDSALAERIAEALAAPALVAAVQAWTQGPPRFRLVIAGRGKQRAVLRRVAQAQDERGSVLRADTRDYTWTVRVDPQRGRLACFPRGADDRFAYRRDDVPAATHPTFAALMAWEGRPRAGECVWDPFCGSATELVECARLATDLRLIGTDRSAPALDAARKNLAAASIEGCTVELHHGHALRTPALAPGRVDLILSNPPMGRRVTVEGDGLRRLLHDFVAHAARVLAPGGRMIWLSPAPRSTAHTAEHHGLRVRDLDPIDMGGFFSTPQRFDKPRS